MTDRIGHADRSALDPRVRTAADGIASTHHGRALDEVLAVLHQAVRDQGASDAISDGDLREIAKSIVDESYG